MPTSTIRKNQVRKIRAARPSALVGGILASLAAITSLPSHAAAPIRYKDDVFANVAATANVQYGSSPAYTGATENLLLNLYQPQGDTAKARPLFIWVHGGGFSGGTKDDGDVVALCQVFARKGYVTATIGYRLEPSSRIDTKAAMSVETYRAVQDAKAAVRFLRAHKADYRIDDTRIFMGGTSAGGVVSLLYAYMDQAEVPADVDANALGGLDGSGGTPGVSSAINGIINCWGGLGDSTWLNNGKLPVLHFHGTNDPTVPYDKGYALGNPALTTFGSACLHRTLIRAGVHSVLKPFVGMGHGVPGGDARADTLISMTRDFAWDVLFGGASTVVKAGKKSGTMEMPARLLGQRGIRADGKILEPDSRPASWQFFH
jgi:para-nitrobenzyl esterase